MRITHGFSISFTKLEKARAGPWTPRAPRVGSVCRTREEERAVETYFCGAGQIFDKDVQKARETKPTNARPPSAFPVRGGIWPPAGEGHELEYLEPSNSHPPALSAAVYI